ncbi:FAD-dependent monooxygenase [Ruegeria arenilitoris]|uniref:FAD-dependent monooxygenase n=1 Tax=Ruegeria arenilitoris TaxID=1173585 RepID=UPI001479C783|nr:FAD-dependent monooxygenase [Ruegeria arenilitoris]
MNVADLKFAVVGAGIGGLAAAIALRMLGAQVVVLEQAPEITEVGAGLQISANGMTVLRALGVVKESPEQAQISHGTVLRDYKNGRFISLIPQPLAGPTYYYHRADLIDLLLKRAYKEDVEIRLKTKVQNIKESSGPVEIRLPNSQPLRVDCLIAADGGRSEIRATLNDQERPRFTKQVAWRATIPWDRNLSSPKAHLTVGPGRHIVTYPLRDQSLLNIVAVEERSDWQEEGWRLKGDPDELRARFSDFGGNVREVLQKVQETYLWALFLRPVAGSWQNGRIALLGDSAHPTLPFMAQGACLALEDAWVLARSFERTTLAESLEKYEHARSARARRVVDVASANARNFHLSGPMRLAAQMLLKAVGPRMGRRYDWIYDYDATA